MDPVHSISTRGEIRSEPEQMDSAWFDEALTDAGVARGAHVTDVEFAGYIGTGQTGRNARFRLTWDVGDAGLEGRPRSVVAKIPSGAAEARMAAFANGSYQTEWAFYCTLAPTLDVRAPQCYVARFDAEAADFVLIMEDLDRSAQGDQFAGLTADEAALVLDQAVGLHAPRWGDASLADFGDHRPRGDEAAMMLAAMYSMLVDPFLARLGPGLDDDIVELVRALATTGSTWSLASDTPRTAVHLDFRPDNLLFGQHPDAPAVAVVDWQTATWGNAMWDLAYLIGGSFEPQQRAAVERDLLTEYGARMAVAGVQYDADAMWRDYRLGSLWGVVMTTIATVLAAETERGNEMLTVMGQRHGRHAIDLGALDLVRSLA